MAHSKSISYHVEDQNMREYVEKQLHTRVDCEPQRRLGNNDAKLFPKV